MACLTGHGQGPALMPGSHRKRGGHFTEAGGLRPGSGVGQRAGHAWGKSTHGVSLAAVCVVARREENSKREA